MKKHVVAPLVLLSSITLLTSCMNKEEKTPVVAPTTESVAPVEVVTTPVTPTTPSDTSPTGLDAGAIPPSGTPVVPPAPVQPESMAPAPVAMSKKETVSYMSPAGSETIELSLSVSDGMVTAVSATPQATNEVSKKLQTSFAANVATQVVGKKISELSFDAIGGASLTTGAFKKFVQAF